MEDWYWACKCMNRDPKMKIIKSWWEELPCKNNNKHCCLDYPLGTALNPLYNLALITTLGMGYSSIRILQVRK